MNARNLTAMILVAALAAVTAGASTLTPGTERIVSEDDLEEYMPQVAYNSVHDEFFVVWHEKSPLQGRWVMGECLDSNGVPIAAFTIAFEFDPPRDNAQPSVAYDPYDDVYLVTWVHDFNGDGSDWDVYGRIVPWNGPAPSDTPFSICSFTSNQWNPRVAYAGSTGEFLVTWWNEGTTGVNSYISAQRVTPAGVLTGSNFTVTSGSEERVAPDIAYEQVWDQYLIVFQLMDAGGGNIYGVRLTDTGTIIGSGAFAIAAWPDPETMPRVAAIADEWGVAWRSDTGSEGAVYARRLWVGGSGTTVFAAPVLISDTTSDENAPDITAHPGNAEYVVTYEGEYTNSHYGIHAKTVNMANLTGPETVIVLPGSSSDRTLPAIAAAPDSYFIVWQHDRDAATSYQDIHGRVVFGPIFADGFETGPFFRWDFISP